MTQLYHTGSLPSGIWCCTLVPRYCATSYVFHARLFHSRWSKPGASLYEMDFQVREFYQQLSQPHQVDAVRMMVDGDWLYLLDTENSKVAVYHRQTHFLRHQFQIFRTQPPTIISDGFVAYKLLYLLVEAVAATSTIYVCNAEDGTVVTQWEVPAGSKRLCVDGQGGLWLWVEKEGSKRELIHFH